MLRPSVLTRVSIATLATAICFASAATAQAAIKVTDSAIIVDGAEAGGAATDAGSTEGSADSSAAPSASSDTGLTEIVVTATKRETNLQKTPISISVMGAEDIKKRHVESLYDLADGGVPSLRVATFEARQSALTVGIRGIVPLDANQPAREQGVGIYVDGVYLGRQHGLNAALFDVERIEVEKGPQGTLFGRNTEGGALSIVTKAPTGVWGGRISGGFGNYGSYTGEVHLNLPEVAHFSVKLDGILQHQNATTKDPLAGSTGWNYYNRRGGRVSVRWKPTSNITDDFSYDNGYDANTPFYSQLLNFNPNGCVATGAAQAQSANVIPGGCVLPGTNFTGGLTGSVKPLLPGVVVNGTSRMDTADIGVPQQPSIDRTHGFTNTFKWKVSPELEIRSITAWRGVSATQWDNSGGYHRVPVISPTAAVCTQAAVTGPTPPSACSFSRYSLADLHQNQFSQELQAVGTIGKLDYVLGLYYFNEHVSDDAATPNSEGIYFDASGNAVYTPIVFCTASTPQFAGYAVNGCSIDRASEVHSKSYAAFAHLTYHLSDAVHITVGGRYTHDQKKGVLHFSRNINYDNPTNSATVATQIAANGYVPLDKTWNRFNPMATIAWDATPDLHFYATFSEGYRAGGASSRTSDYRAFDPEDVKNYEIGMKADFWDRKARLNIAAYMMDRKGSQVDLSTIQPTATGNFNNLVTFNAPGTTKIRGVEADLTVKPIPQLSMNLSYAYTYTDIPAVPITYSAFCTGAGAPVVTPPCLALGQLINSTPNQLQKFYIVFTPRNAVSGSIDYNLPVAGNGAELRLHLDANYSEATQAFDQFATNNDASFIVNGRLALADIPMGGAKLTVAAWVRNMFDKQYVFRRDPSNSLPSVQATNTLIGSISNVLGDYGNFNAPRTFGLEASISF